jgi:hypothetical protein
VSNHKWPFRVVVLAAVLSLALMQASAWAQTSKLSPGDQKIAQALFEAQSKQSKSGVQPLTRDQIVAMKSQKGWGEVFKDMKSKGLVTQRNLGQVVSEFERRHPEMAKIDTKPDKVDKVEKADKPDKVEKPAKPEKPGR